MAQRYILNNPSTLLKEENPRQQLVLSLEKLLKGFPPREDYSRHELHGLYSGPTSIACLFLNISQMCPDLVVNGHHLRTWFKAYLSAKRHAPHVSADDCGVINETLAFSAVHAALTGDQQDISVLESYASFIATKPDGSDEWLYGRAGFLYLLRLVRYRVPSSKAVIDPCIQKVGDRIIENGPRWRWHGKEYLGAVHGAVGIITQLILSDTGYATHPKVISTLRELLSVQAKETGNFPSSVDSGKDYFVQFCHGAPGFALSLPLIQQYFDPSTQATIDQTMAKARACIWEKGLLTKEPNLCHGATANALALSSPQREHFMAQTTASRITKGMEEGWYFEGSDPYGLFCGEAGRAWGWAVLDVEKDMGIIGYSDV
ncbi:MAG: hypothetical protein Q9225_003205 [Loekoesia sp. 1 TL-2023]